MHKNEKAVFLNNNEPSCVGCGVCSAVCPRGVLKLENGNLHGRINPNEILLGNDVNLIDLLKR